MAERDSREPPIETRRERRRREKAQEIIAIAMRLVVTEGLEACSLNRISRELDVAVAGLYRYFPSKMALIAALELQVIAELAAVLEAAHRPNEPPNNDVDALFRLVSIGEAYRRYADESPARFALIQQIMADPKLVLTGEFGQQVLSAMMDLLGQVAASIRVAEEQGALDSGSPLERAVVFWNGVRSVLQMRKLEAHSPLVNHRELFRSMVTTLLRGWGARQEAIETAWSRVAAI